MSYPKSSIIVSTYNRPDALRLCLKSIAKQVVLPDEVVIGDDGSKQDTIDLIRDFQKDFPVPLLHVWQKDEGFRLAQCRNKAVAACSHEYIIEIDGDLILHPRFVEDHLRFAQKGHFIKGGRVNLDKQLTAKVCASGEIPPLHPFAPGLMRRVNAVHCFPLSKYLSTHYKKNSIVGLGCNMSFWKEDYIRINGYDEFFVGWGGEDYDFALRMLNSGVKRLYLKFSAIVFHLWHEDKFMQNKDKNFEYYDERIKEHATRCENGVDKYLK